MIKLKQTGFTIVELLIVVVVIAILAAITIVAYNGIQSRAKASAAQSAAKQAGTKILTYSVQNADQYPSDIAAAGLTNTSDTTYQYRVDNSVVPKTFCITVTTQNLSYYVTSIKTSPTEGACEGHGLNGATAITNLIPNPIPSVQYYGTTGSHTLTWYNGTNALGGSGYVTSIANSSNGDGRAFRRDFALQPLTTYTFSAYVRYNSGTTSNVGAGTIRYDTWGGIAGSSGNSCSPTSGSGWCRVYVTFTVPADIPGNTGLMLYTTSTATSIDTSNWMLTEGTTLNAYADGNTGGWLWNGTPNNSTSSGSPL